MKVNALMALAILALLWPAAALRAAVTKTTWSDAPAREFVFVENNSDDNFFVTPGGALDPRMTGANRWTGLKYTGSGTIYQQVSVISITATTPGSMPTGSLICGWKTRRFRTP
ncbi:CFA/I fimbrial minor adhesin [Klebsiella aerogenes]|nr:CFA/I fimbrial minor adhesin [Klebsiella aerogenes]